MYNLAKAEMIILELEQILLKLRWGRLSHSGVLKYNFRKALQYSSSGMWNVAGSYLDDFWKEFSDQGVDCDFLNCRSSVLDANDYEYFHCSIAEISKHLAMEKRAYSTLTM